MVIICRMLISVKAMILLLAVQLIFFSMYGQASNSRRRENFDVRKFDVKAISISTPGNKLSLTNVHGVDVIDARADTSRVGFMQKKTVAPHSTTDRDRQDEQRLNRRPTFLRLNNGVQKDVQQFAKQYLQFTENDTLPDLLMVIKKLWLSDELNLDENQEGNNKVLATGLRDTWTSGAAVNIEFYVRVKKDYYALYRYDTVISKALTISEYGPEFIALALQLSLAKLPYMGAKISGVANRRKFSLDEINRHNEDAYNFPVLKDSIRAGVYMTFDEFKNNNPSITSFTLKKEKLADFLYIRQADGKEAVARDVWGYSNGKATYIKAGDNFFLLQRMENAFYIFGVKNLKWQDARYFYSPLPGIPVAKIQYQQEGYISELKPFQLDWSTGKLY